MRGEVLQKCNTLADARGLALARSLALAGLSLVRYSWIVIHILMLENA